MGNPHFRYYSKDIAEGITLTGQLTIQYISNKINEFLNTKLKTNNLDFVIANDTDSAYIELNKLVEAVVPNNTPNQKIVDFLDKFVEQHLTPFIDSQYEELSSYVNAVENTMSMKRESICDRAMWRAKKNYVLQIYDNEGVRFAEPKLKAVGIEIARSSTPERVRKALEDGLKIVLNESEEQMQSYVNSFKNEFLTLPIETIASPRGINDIHKWVDSTHRWKSGCPIHVKASIVYNHELTKHGLDKKHQYITNGSKMKFVYLTIPNPTLNNAIAFTDELHEQFNLHQYVDRELQFEKTFLNPMQSFTSILGWHTTKQSSLGDFFSSNSELTDTEKQVIIKKSVKTKKPTVSGNSLDSFFN